MMLIDISTTLLLMIATKLYRISVDLKDSTQYQTGSVIIRLKENQKEIQGQLPVSCLGVQSIPILSLRDALLRVGIEWDDIAAQQDDNFPYTIILVFFNVQILSVCSAFHSMCAH